MYGEGRDRVTRRALPDVPGEQAVPSVALTHDGISELSDTPSSHGEIIRNLPVGVLVLRLTDPQDVRSARLTDVNPAAAEFADTSAGFAVGRTLEQIPQFSKVKLAEKCVAILQSQTPMDLGEIRMKRAGNRIGSYRVRGFRLPSNRIGLTLEDIGTQKATRRAIRRSEERFRLLVQGVRDYAIYLLDPKGKVLSWNEGAERLKGYRAEEIVGQNYAVFFTQEDREAGKPEEQLRKARDNRQAEDEGWRVRKDGTRFWVNTVLTALRDARGKLCGYAKVMRDITERRTRDAVLRAAKEELEIRVRERTAELVHVNQRLEAEVRERQRGEEQLHALATRLQSAQEVERVRLAREIHDALGQMCTALKMDIAFIAKKLPKEEHRLREKSASAMKLVDDLIQSLRRLSAELRPSTLDTLGLTAAMEWQAQEFQNHTGIRCQLHLPENGVSLEPQRSTAVFRIFQEALTNVARHAQASLVQVDLIARADKMMLVVHDNGKGFNPSVAELRSSLGLLGMKERSRLIGGELNLSSSPGKGTTVTIHIPLQPSS